MSSYATPSELASLSLPADALADITTQDQQTAIDAASDEADSYFRSRYTLPLTGTIPEALKQAVCDIAAYRLMKRRGFDPDQDPSVRQGFTDALGWLDDVGNSRITPTITDSSGSVTMPVAPRVTTSPKRGW